MGVLGKRRVCLQAHCHTVSEDSEDWRNRKLKTALFFYILMSRLAIYIPAFHFQASYLTTEELCKFMYRTTVDSRVVDTTVFNEQFISLLSCITSCLAGRNGCQCRLSCVCSTARSQRCRASASLRNVLTKTRMGQSVKT